MRITHWILPLAALLTLGLPLAAGTSTGGGTIYFDWTSVGTAMMNSDGSGKTGLACNGREPSRLLHGGNRWFLVGIGTTGTYPSGYSRSELFATLAGGQLVQLTDYNSTGLEPLGNDNGFIGPLRWEPGDSKITWTARHWNTLTNQVDSGGIYEADIAYDQNANIIGLASAPTLLFAFPLIQLSDGNPGPDIGGYDWSPDGSRIVYAQLSTFQLWIRDRTGATTLLYNGGGHHPVWSPAGSLIAFDSGYPGTIYTINTTGSGLKAVASGRSGANPVQIALPIWSPTGSNLIYEQDTGNVLNGTARHDVIRTTSSGGAATNLTKDIAGGSPLGWR